MVEGGDQKYSWQSNGGSEINNPWGRGRRGIIYLFKAYEGFQNSDFIKCPSIWLRRGGGRWGAFIPRPPARTQNSIFFSGCLNLSAILFTIGNMVLVSEACYNTLLLSLYLDLPLDSIAAGQDIMVYKFMLSRCFCSEVNFKPSLVVSDLQVPSANLLCRPLILSAFKIRIPNRHKLKEKSAGK